MAEIARRVAGHRAELLPFLQRIAAEREFSALGPVSARSGENLAELLRVRPIAATRPPLFALAVRYFFRREVEANPQLAFGLVLDFVQDISQSQRAGFAALDATLTQHGVTLQR